MAVKDSENKAVNGVEDKIVAANGMSTIGANPDGKDVEVTLAGHFTHEGKNYLPGDKIKVSPDFAASLRNSGYAVRED